MSKPHKKRKVKVKLPSGTTTSIEVPSSMKKKVASAYFTYLQDTYDYFFDKLSNAFAIARSSGHATIHFTVPGHGPMPLSDAGWYITKNISKEGKTLGFKVISFGEWESSDDMIIRTLNQREALIDLLVTSTETDKALRNWLTAINADEKHSVDNDIRVDKGDTRDE